MTEENQNATPAPESGDTRTDKEMEQEFRAATEELQNKRRRPGRFMDFDAGRVEPEPIRLMIRGIEIHAPGDMPAAVVFALHDLGRDPERPATAADMLRLGHACFGRDGFERLLETGITPDEIGMLFPRLITAWSEAQAETPATEG